MKEKIPPRHYLVVDLEATCSDDDSVARDEMEIIEIGAVMVDTTDLAPVAEYQTFIRPVRHPKLTPFCTSLTTISQIDLEKAPTFAHGWASFVQWKSSFDDVVLASWGAYDKNQMQQDCRFHRCKYPFGKRHLNIKNAFAQKVGIKRGLGMKAALDMAELEMTGTHHRGIDDARNIAKLLPWALGEKKISPDKSPTRRGRKG